MPNKIDNLIGKLLYPALVKADLKSNTIKALTLNMDDETFKRFIYNRHKKVYKKYGITLEQISKVIDNQKNKRGFGTKLVLRQARMTIRDAISSHRIIFIDDDKAEYIDRHYHKSTVSFDELAKIFIDKSGQRDNMAGWFAISEADIKSILQDEYKRHK